MTVQGILKPAQWTPSFVLPLFLVPKTDGSLRPIFNLQALNEFVKSEHFCLINMTQIPNFLQKRDWMCKIDLSQAYFHLKIAKVHRRFLRLIYLFIGLPTYDTALSTIKYMNIGKHIFTNTTHTDNEELLEITCLPFGISTTPKTFSILTNWIAQTLRQRNARTRK